MQIDIIGVPIDLGADRRGVDMGPSAIRSARLRQQLELLGCEVQDKGNLEVLIAEMCNADEHNMKYVDCIVSMARRAAGAVATSMQAGHFPLVLGGDHSVALGSINGAAKVKKIGVIWVDAHADMNTPATSPSGNVHGMPLASILGMGPKELTHLAGVVPMVDPRNTVLVGIRDVDAHERPQVKRSGMHAFTMRDIDEHGMMTIMRQALAIAGDGTAGVHLSLDMDSLDPGEAPGVGTPVRGGLSYREAHLAMEMACDSGLLESMEVVEVNPVLDERNRTAQLAVELVTSALGKRIL